MNEENEVLDLTDSSNIIGKKVKYITIDGEVLEDVVISFIKEKEDNYIRLYLVKG